MYIVVFVKIKKQLVNIPSQVSQVRWRDTLSSFKLKIIRARLKLFYKLNHVAVFFLLIFLSAVHHVNIVFWLEIV